MNHLEVASVVLGLIMCGHLIIGLTSIAIERARRRKRQRLAAELRARTIASDLAVRRTIAALNNAGETARLELIREAARWARSGSRYVDLTTHEPIARDAFEDR